MQFDAGMFLTGIVNLIHRRGVRVADNTYERMIRGCLGEIWRIRQPFARPLSCSRLRTAPGAPHDTVLHQGDDGGDKNDPE
jgi:hypothetical protein